MSQHEALAAASKPSSASAVSQGGARYWPAVVLVVAYWAFVVATRVADLAISTVFLSNMAASAVLALSFTIWWLTNRRISRSDRWIAFLAVVVGGIAAALLCDPSVGGLGIILFGIPVTLTGWLLWMLVTRNMSIRFRRGGLLVVLLLAWGNLTVVRVDGIDGSNNAAVSWRWKPSAEDVYLITRAQASDRSRASAGAESVGEALQPQRGDWTEFRGPNQQGAVYDVRIATEWNERPPLLVWRQRIGPAWSSVLIVGDRLFTQEQRGESEATVCLECATGHELWSHEDQARFSDGQAGAGPRATPTFADGRLYTLGASGILDCLDAATGKLLWSRNIVEDTGAPVPIWGFSSSPLVAAGNVTVYAGGKENKGLVAYRAESGEPVWSAPTGEVAYGSAQLATIDGTDQVLLLSNQGLIAVEPTTGKMLWQHEAPVGGMWRVVQPRQIDGNGILIGSEDLGLVRLEVTRDEQAWKPNVRWTTAAIRPAYNDFVIWDGNLYGFDESIFCCIDLQTGKRRWKGGRYGHGQVLLLADQPVLLVVSETGEVILMATNPDKHEELARFQAVHGKTWNHPVIAHGRLYVRNDEEIACFAVELADATKPSEGPAKAADSP